jgi:hypothetical protein
MLTGILLLIAMILVPIVLKLIAEILERVGKPVDSIHRGRVPH